MVKTQARKTLFSGPFSGKTHTNTLPLAALLRCLDGACRTATERTPTDVLCQVELLIEQLEKTFIVAENERID
ncbi:hypothetical protein [Entomohabitans teleogrylli]|uniref:hypothetical protein n=1 Tax=Entomohabitans teleogrylli TaxID=1384589 RepID=UPI000A8DEB6E|nr:hypothetical protein [Entomohabitans teleogrylli]